jgi:two-component system sensor histidine kinase KdpD
LQRQRIVRALDLASSLGAETATLSADDAVATVVDYAREHNLSRVLVGRDHPRPWQPWYRSMAERVGHAAPDLDVVQVARNDDARTAVPSPTAPPTPGEWLAYLKATAICAVATALAAPLAGAIELTNIAMLFLLAVLIVAMRLGRGPAVLSAFLAVAAFDFFFVPPRFSFAVSDAQYLMTFAVMLIVALITGQLTARYKQHAEVATQREARARGLYEMARDLSAALLPVQIAEACDRFLVVEFGAQAALLLTDTRDHLQAAILAAKTGTGETPAVDEGVARWAFDHGEAAGLSTDTLPGSPLLYLPLKAPMRTRGVLAIAPRDPLRVQGPEARRQLETFASLVAIAVERMHYVDVAQTTLLQMESESLRNSLLSAISHDLRTPLSVLVGLAESIRLTQPPPTDAQATIAATLKEEALRMSTKVNSLLDMARLQAGKVQLKRQWQPLEEVVGSALMASDVSLAAHSVHTALPDDLPLLEFDGVLIERVLCNLLDNAAKYTPAGTPVSIGAAARESEVEVWVDDNGPGLPRGREESIFEKFERGARESTTSGVGLGLAICRAIVEAHGGRIHAENRPGGGARFIFSLPRGVPPTVAEEGGAT